MPHGLDTEDQVFFYEQEFYVLSNFSSFAIEYEGKIFPTAEHLYHWFKFDEQPQLGIRADAVTQTRILNARSAHDAYKIAHEEGALVRHDWYEIRVPKMAMIIRLKTSQHEYVKRKLLETGRRRLTENSHRDNFWGWGPNKDGKDILGRLWELHREELRFYEDCNKIKREENTKIET